MEEQLHEKVADLGKLDEEFNNFMHRVKEVGNIIKKLASKDKQLQEIGDTEAKKYLGEEKIVENINEEQVSLQITSNRSVINKKALMKADNLNENEMSKECFMEEVSKDAEKRYKDRLVRTEKMETLKKQATLAFRRGEYEKALVLYNKAIDQIKDSPLLYNNRALTFMKLGLFDKAKTDLEEWALRLNENCLRSWLLLAKANLYNEDQEGYKKCVLEAKQRNPEQTEFIEEYQQQLENDFWNGKKYSTICRDTYFPSLMQITDM